MECAPAAKGIISVIASVAFLVLLSVPIGRLPPLGGLANPGGGIWSVADQAVYPTRMELTFPELDGSVTVHRDTLGIPHIFAATEHDLFFAQGFVHAQDRLWQMDISRRIAEGKLAEVFGAKVGSFDVVGVDTFVRTIGLPDLAHRFWRDLDPASPGRGAVIAYAEGVNAFLRYAGSAGLPLEFKLLDYRPSPWVPEDTAALGFFLAWSLSGSFEDVELALLEDRLTRPAVDELFPISGPYQRPVDPRWPDTRGGASLGPGLREAARDLFTRSRALAALAGGPFVGSNNWAVNGSRTDTGKPRLANDPHLSLQMPAIWYENHLVGGGFDVYGVTFPGTPTVILGQNRRIAWGATNVGADVVDLYRETIKRDAYLFRGQWKSLDKRVETIQVKGGAPVAVTIRSTGHGPLVTERGETLAMRWTGQDARDLIGAFYAIDRAGNWDEFKAALTFFPVPAQNFVYADIDGHIGMRSNGWYPQRIGFDGRFPLDGASGDFEWRGWVPFEEYPESFDPIEGYVLSANQQPAASNYPYYLGWSWDPGYRARRIAEMLRDDERVTADDLRAMQLDTLDTMAREVVPFIRDAVTGNCATTECSAALAAIGSWDFRMDETQAAPAIWWRFANQLREEMFEDEWGRAGVSDLMMPPPNVMEFLLKERKTSPWFDDVRTPAVETWQDIVRRAFESAVDDLTRDLGPQVSEWRWGDVHHRQFGHLTQLEALGRGPFPSPGDSLTVNVAPGDLASAGPSWRLLADLSDVTKSKGVYPGGQSGNPLSRHYDDLLMLWLRGEYHDLILPGTAGAMTPASVESTLILRGS